MAPTRPGTRSVSAFPPLRQHCSLLSVTPAAGAHDLTATPLRANGLRQRGIALTPERWLDRRIASGEIHYCTIVFPATKYAHRAIGQGFSDRMFSADDLRLATVMRTRATGPQIRCA